MGTVLESQCNTCESHANWISHRRQSFQLSGPLFILWCHFKNQLTYDVLGALSGLIFRQVQSTFKNFARMYKLHKCNDFTQCNFSIAMIPNSVKFEINKPISLTRLKSAVMWSYCDKSWFYILFFPSYISLHTESIEHCCLQQFWGRQRARSSPTYHREFVRRVRASGLEVYASSLQHGRHEEIRIPWNWRLASVSFYGYQGTLLLRTRIQLNLSQVLVQGKEVLG